jgi:hypothetical protein
MSQDGESSALHASELNALAFEFCFEDTVFFPKIGDDVSLVAVDFGSQPGDQE